MPQHSDYEETEMRIGIDFESFKQIISLADESLEENSDDLRDEKGAFPQKLADTISEVQRYLKGSRGEEGDKVVLNVE